MNRIVLILIAAIYSQITINALSIEPQNDNTTSMQESRSSFGNQRGRIYGSRRTYGTINSGRQSSTRTTVSAPNNKSSELLKSYSGSTLRHAPSRSFIPSGNRSLENNNKANPSTNKPDGLYKFGGNRK